MIPEMTVLTSSFGFLKFNLNFLYYNIWMNCFIWSRSSWRPEVPLKGTDLGFFCNLTCSLNQHQHMSSSEEKLRNKEWLIPLKQQSYIITHCLSTFNVVFFFIWYKTNAHHFLFFNLTGSACALSFQRKPFLGLITHCGAQLGKKKKKNSIYV